MSKPSKLETIKQISDQLRGSIHEEMGSSTESVSEPAKQLLKFHGIYQQDDRDRRKQLRAAGQSKAHSFMLRARIPGGRLTAEQYLLFDALADQFGGGTLRLTTRQTIQLHGVLKEHVRETIQKIDSVLLTTMAACGDVVRNVMSCPAPDRSPIRAGLEAHARQISQHFLPRTSAYHDIWLDGQPWTPREPSETSEPIYGTTYLPRKFKIAIAAPHDNCVDVLTQDIGIIPLVEGQRLIAFLVAVGGGLGMTHNKPGTFPRLADPMAVVAEDDLLSVVEQIVITQRDHGDRSNRRHARLKYLIEERGVEWMRAHVERGLGHRLDDPVDLPPMQTHLHLGWHEQAGGGVFVGLPVPSGRVIDREQTRLKSAIRNVVADFGAEVHLTPHQDLLLSGFHQDQRHQIEQVLDRHGVVPASTQTPARLHAMACPALPTCGLALTEAERVLDPLVTDIERVLERLGLQDEPITVRMTGCPNGCARPYAAEIGIVGRSADKYVIFLGGRHDGTRLARPFADLVARDRIVPLLERVLRAYRRERIGAESFGDYCDRLGPDALSVHNLETSLAPSATPAMRDVS